MRASTPSFPRGADPFLPPRCRPSPSPAVPTPYSRRALQAPHSAADCTDRPLLEGLDPVERGRKVETMMNLREPIYSRADFTIDTDSQDPGLLADAIYSRLQRHEELT